LRYIPSIRVHHHTPCNFSLIFSVVSKTSDLFVLPGIFMKITKSFFRSLALASILLPSSFLQAGPVAEKWSELKSSLEPAKIEQKIKDKITSLDIGFDLDLIDLDLFDGAGLAAKYRYEVEPSYHGDWYTRVD